jgi:cyclopropane fatty-acyl-phospholipid synthase-like methyltransferase
MLEYLSRDEIVDAFKNLKGLLGEDGTMMVFITRQNILNRWLIQAWWKGNMYTRDEISRVFHDAGLSMTFKRFPFPYSHLNLWGHVMVAKKKTG